LQKHKKRTGNKQLAAMAGKRLRLTFCGVNQPLRQAATH